MPPKPLPAQQPNPGERLVIRNLTPSGRFDWYYTSITANQISRTGGDPNVRLIEVHIKNLRVSELEAVVANFPATQLQPGTPVTRTSGTIIWLVVDLDEDFSAATDHALEFIKTAGISDTTPLDFQVNKDDDRTTFSIQRATDAEDMRRALFSGLTVEYDPSQVDGAQVLEFWEDVGALRDLSWSEEEMTRWVYFKWALQRKMNGDEKGSLAGFTLGLWALGGLVVLGGAWAYLHYAQQFPVRKGEEWLM